MNHEQLDGTATASAESMPQAVRSLELVASSTFVALFSAALFDQTMLPEVSAALEATGRIRNTPFERAGRSAASDQLVFLGEESERITESERLVRLHRDVKGISPDGVRYSALAPESWNWILYSTYFMHLGAHRTLTGQQLTGDDAQAAWDYFRAKAEHLQLPGQSRLLANYDDACAYYATMAAEKLQRTATTDNVVDLVRRPPRPDFLPRVTAPAWAVVSPLAGEALSVLGYGIMHPDVRARLPFNWTRRHDMEFKVLSTAARLGYRYLPAWITLTPLARNRRQYQQLVRKYQDVGLTSFAPEYVKPSLAGL